MRRRQEDWFGPHELHLGMDVGKSFHWAVGLDQEGEVRISRGWRTVWTMSTSCSRRQATPPWSSWTRRTTSAPEM